VKDELVIIVRVHIDGVELVEVPGSDVFRNIDVRTAASTVEKRPRVYA